MKKILVSIVFCFISGFVNAKFFNVDYQKGYNMFLIGDYERAIFYFDKAIKIESENLAAFYFRGKSHMKLNNSTNSKLDFQKVIQLDKGMLTSYIIPFSKYYLGQKEAALEDMNNLVRRDNNKENYFYLAWLYALDKNANSTIKNLHIAFSKGYDNLVEISENEDLGFILKSRRFNSILKNYNFPVFKQYSFYDFPIMDSLEILMLRKVTTWQQKGEFETSTQYLQRVNEISRNAYAIKAQEQVLEELKQKFNKSIDWRNELSLGKYDTDNSTFLITSKNFGEIVLSVSLESAPSFKSNFESLRLNPDFYYASDKDEFLLDKLTFTDPTTQKTFTYDSKQGSKYAQQKIDYNFAPIVIEPVGTTSRQNTNQITTQTLAVGKADVDVNIPVATAANEKTFAIIIANEKYQNLVPVNFASNDGSTFKEYCEKTLGLPKENVKFYPDATYGTMLKAINYAQNVIGAYKGEAKIIFYYAGHGVPNEADKAAYLLPVDGTESEFEAAIKLETLYAKLTEKASKQVIVVLDACFSGSIRDNGMLAMARGVKVKPKKDEPIGNMVVLSAATGDETAYPYKEKGHGLFTYYLLKKLQETKGDIALGSLYEYIQTNVNQKSVSVNSKSQTPQAIYSSKLGEAWKSWTMK